MDRENLVKLVCGKCGHHLYMPARDVLTYGEPYPETPIGYNAAIGLDGLPMQCSRHGSGRYFLQAASEQPGGAEMSASMKPQPLHIRDDGAAFIGKLRVEDGYPVELVLRDDGNQLPNRPEKLLGILMGLEEDRLARIVFGRTPKGREMAINIRLEDTLLIPRPDLL